MNRRGFLGSILALGAAPAIVRADSLMKIIPLDTDLVTAVWPMQDYGDPSTLFFNVRDFGAVGDGVTDDTASIQRATSAVSLAGALYFPPGSYHYDPRAIDTKFGSTPCFGAGSHR